MLKNQALRGDMMRGHAATIEARDQPDGRRLGRRGRDRPARLVRRADDLHDLGVPDRQAVPRGARLLVRAPLPRARARHRRASRTSTPTPTSSRFRLRDAAREKLVELVQAIIDKRKARGTVAREERDLLDVLISIDMTADYITGIFISMMFAGHHTSSGTASWALIELMRNPEVMAAVVAELDDLYADGSRGLLPGAALDPAAGGGAQGDAAAAPAADHPDARRAGGDRARRAHDPAGHGGGGLAAGVEPDRRGLPGAGDASTRRATSTRARRTCRTGGPGSRSAPASTAASATRSR